MFIGNTHSAGDLARLRELGIRRVVRCHPKSVLDSEHPDIRYLELPWGDGLAQEKIGTHLERAVRFLDGAVRRGDRCLVHCVAGMNRSGSVAVAYTMRALGLGFDEALLVVLAARPIVSPNEEFRRELRDMECGPMDDGGGGARSVALPQWAATLWPPIEDPSLATVQTPPESGMGSEARAART